MLIIILTRDSAFPVSYEVGEMQKFRFEKRNNLEDKFGFPLGDLNLNNREQ